MCNQCSFQLVLRNLRFKQRPRHHHAGKQVPRSLNRRYTSASLSQAASSTSTLPLSKPLPFGLPSLHFLSQSYSIWSPTSSSSKTTPLAPKPAEILKENPFTSQEGVASLLHSLASHPDAFVEIDKIICPIIEGLLSVHHYAGARAVLERLLDEIVHFPDGRLPLGRKLLHKLISTLQGTIDFHKKPNWELHSLLAMRPMLSLILQYLIAYPEKFSINTLTIKVLVAIPEYLDLRSISLLLQLFDEVVKTDPQGEALSRNVATLHNIMRVYALHGHSTAAEQWMNVILDVQQSTPKRQQIASTSSTRSSGKTDARSTALRMASAKLKKTLDAKASVLYLGTTYLSSLAQPESKGAPAPIVDSRIAMTFFQELWKPNLLGDGSSVEEVSLPPEVIELDIHAWSAIIHSAALDLNRISSQTLIDVLHALEKYPSLPKPSAVPYTAVMGGLNRRGDYQRTIDLFEHEIVPKAIQRIENSQSDSPASEGKQEEMVIDAQLLGSIVLAWTGLGDIGMAVNVVKWFGSSAQEEVEKTVSLDENAERSEAEPTMEKAIIEHRASFPEALRGTVKVDTILVNQIMTYLGQTARYNSVYNLFASMTELYNVYPDETTLTILARTALSAGKMKRKGLVPDFAEDVWQATTKIPQEEGEDVESGNFFMNGFTHLRNALSRQTNTQDLAKETGVWDGVQPVERVMDIYWAMLEQNFDSAHERAVKDNMKTTTTSFFSFGRPIAPTNLEITEPQDTNADVAAEGLQQQTLTSRLQDKRSEEHYHYSWPSLYPTHINMHMLIALSGYFGRGSDIPLILSHMKQLNMKPSHRTLCLSLWSYEETGVYASEFRKFQQWLIEWLGEMDVPTDDEVGAFRARQWGGSGGA